MRSQRPSLSENLILMPRARRFVFYRDRGSDPPTREGRPYTGLKPVGRDLGPAMPAGDKAIEDVKLVTDASERLSENAFKRHLLQKASTEKDVRAGREHVEVYVEFVHYAEEV